MYTKLLALHPRKPYAQIQVSKPFSWVFHPENIHKSQNAKRQTYCFLLTSSTVGW